MLIFEWKGEYELGFSEIDAQHKKLVSMINDLGGSAKKGYQTSQDELAKKIDGLAEYAVFHFDYEEKYMKEFEYSLYEQHKREHESFKGEVVRLKGKISKEEEISVIDLASFLLQWFVNHEVNFDQKYVEIFKQKGLK
ncbi:bacteriohemerythrin [Thermoproteota archaeon]